ncbi:MAG TPA: NFACT RNA binding domain-containing protein [Patescibacteria group bacterium]|nr:NFACT RNA binding domain-containing protein [Patescibacteria group bacterium]
MSFDGFSLAPLVTELNRRIAGGRIEKIFQSDEYTLVFWIRQSQENLRLVISAHPVNPKLLLTDALPENPANPPAFCMLLRKHLEDGRIAGLEQYSLDRMVTLSVDIRGEGGVIVTKKLVLELMGKHSNIILVQDALVLDAIKRIGASVSSYRQVFPGREYQYPPGQERLNPLETSPLVFVAAMRQDSPDAVLEKAIIRTGIGIGPQTAREIVWRAGLPGKMPVGQMDDADAAALVEALESLTGPLKEGTVQPTVVVDPEERLLVMAPYPVGYLGTNRSILFPTMNELMAFGGRYHAPPAIPGKASLQSVIGGELNRLQRKEKILQKELAESQDADLYRQCGDLLMNNLPFIPAGNDEVHLTDWFADETGNQQMTIKLDTLLTPLQNAKNYYARYNKGKRAQELLAVQLQQCREDLQYVDSIGVALDHAGNAAEVADIRLELVDAGYVKAMTKKRAAVAASQPLTAVTGDGYEIMIGRNNRQNDMITFKKSHHDDIWLHTKDIPGSHVILRTGGAEPPAAALQAAAILAAYFSKARSSTRVPVDYARRRHVKKPSGAKPGFVIYEHQTTLFVTPDEETVKRLLTSDAKGAAAPR